MKLQAKRGADKEPIRDWSFVARRDSQSEQAHDVIKDMVGGEERGRPFFPI